MLDVDDLLRRTPRHAADPMPTFDGLDAVERALAERLEQQEDDTA